MLHKTFFVPRSYVLAAYVLCACFGFHIDAMQGTSNVSHRKLRVREDSTSKLLIGDLKTSCNEYSIHLIKYKDMPLLFIKKPFAHLKAALKSSHSVVVLMLSALSEEKIFDQLENCGITTTFGVAIPLKSSLISQCHALDDPKNTKAQLKVTLEKNGVKLNSDQSERLIDQLQETFLYEIYKKKNRTVLVAPDEPFTYPILIKLLMGKLLETYLRISDFATHGAVTEEMDEKAAKELSRWTTLLKEKLAEFLRAGGEHWKNEAEKIFDANAPSKGLSFILAAQNQAKLGSNELYDKLIAQIAFCDPFMRCLRRSQKLSPLPQLRINLPIILFLLNHNPQLEDAKKTLLKALDASRTLPDSEPGKYSRDVEDIAHDFVMDFLKYKDLSRAKGRLWEAIIALFFLKNSKDSDTLGKLMGLNVHCSLLGSQFSREFDLLSSKFACECKCVKWETIPEADYQTILEQLQNQLDIIKSHNDGRQFLLISYFPLSDGLKKNLTRLRVAYIDPNNPKEFADLYIQSDYELRI